MEQDVRVVHVHFRIRRLDAGMLLTYVASWKNDQKFR
jgi:hypothetical protein